MRGGGGGGKRRSPSPTRNRSPPQDRRRARSPSSPRSARSSRQASPSDYSRESERYGKPVKPESPKPKIQKEKPDFKPSGRLAAVNKDGSGPALKWGEPPEARLPTKRWRLYVFKAEKNLEPYYIHRQSAYLFGRDRLVVDIPLDHPSCSKQHAVLQYRLVEREDEDGERIKEVKPYIIDLGSTNGTFLNAERIEDSRYYELRESDVLKFGLSTREFVLLHEQSAE
jgi:smad nuclear-interacting protein 1